jgi:hypothetical protein
MLLNKPEVKEQFVKMLKMLKMKIKGQEDSKE